MKGCGKAAAEDASNMQVYEKTAIDELEEIFNLTEGKPKIEEI